MISVVWCVFTYDDGTFKYARPNNRGLIAFSVDHWRELDRAAAEQFIVPDDRARHTQQAFNTACGL